MVPEEAGPAGLELEWAQHLPFVRVPEQPELDRVSIRFKFVIPAVCAFLDSLILYPLGIRAAEPTAVLRGSCFHDLQWVPC